MYRTNYPFLNAVLVIAIAFVFCQVGQAQDFGNAAIYEDKMQGSIMASGKEYNKYKLTVAYNNAPLGAMLKITNVANRKSIEAEVVDRNPYFSGHIVTLSKKAAIKLGLFNEKLKRVKIEIIGGNDTAWEDEFTKKGTKQNLQAHINQSNFGSLVKGKEFQPEGLYKLNLLKSASQEGYAVQIGKYSSLDFVLEKVALIQSIVGDKVLIELGIENKIKSYKLLAGPFTTEESARMWMKKFKYEGHEGFVVPLQ